MDLTCGTWLSLHIAVEAIHAVGIYSFISLCIASGTQCFITYQKEKP